MRRKLTGEGLAFAIRRESHPLPTGLAVALLVELRSISSLTAAKSLAHAAEEKTNQSRGSSRTDEVALISLP